MLNPFIYRVFLFLIIISEAIPGFAQNRITDSLWNKFNQLPADSSRVDTIIQDVLWLQDHLKNSPEEERMLQNALALAHELDYKHGMTTSYNLLGVYYRKISQYVKAISFQKKALDIAKEVQDSTAMSYALNSIGVAYRRLDENQKAFKYHLEALEVAKAIGSDKNQAIAMNSIANIYLSMGHYESAIEEFERCLELEKHKKNNIGQAINYANIGAAYEGLGQLDKAISYYRKSLKYNSIEKSDKGLAICFNLLGEVYLSKGKYDVALSYIRQAISYNDKLRDQINVADNYITIGKILQKKNQIAAALNSMHQGLNIAIQIGSQSLIIEAYTAIAETEEQLGNSSKALSAMKQAYRYRDSLYLQEAAPQMAKMRTLYELDKKEDQIRLLQQANEINQLKLNRRLIIIVTAIIILLLFVIGTLFYLHYRKQKNNKIGLQYELQSLRSQMNPHFIFNALNSIHKFIWNNQQEQASSYLIKFSSLMRMTLQNSRSKSIPLSVEVDFLNLYLELESFRHNDRFDYLIEVEDDIDSREVLIPSMIIQPFVENAILHGLAQKEESDCQLSIRFYKKGDLINCEVEDNGIGRKRAKLIKANKTTARPSLGIKVTEERIMLLQKLSGKKDTQIEIIDLENIDPNTTGTKVRIQLPFEYAF